MSAAGDHPHKLQVFREFVHAIHLTIVYVARGHKVAGVVLAARVRAVGSVGVEFGAYAAQVLAAALDVDPHELLKG